MKSRGLSEYKFESNGQGGTDPIEYILQFYSQVTDTGGTDIFVHSQPSPTTHDLLEKCTMMISELYQHYRPGTAGFFANSRDIVITGGQFTNQSFTKCGTILIS